MGKTDRPALIRVPLLPGESVVDETFKVEEGEVIVNLPRGSQSVEWPGVIHEATELLFKAEQGKGYSERWQVECSPIYSCVPAGLAPTSSTANGRYALHWIPWPGETATLKIEKPKGAQGPTRTIENVTLNYSAGDRLLEGVLTLQLRASTQGLQKIRLPKDAAVQQVSLNGSPSTLRPVNGLLELPYEKGVQNFHLGWQQQWSPGLSTEFPSVDLEFPATNVTITVQSSSNRWILAVRGPKWGPAVLFWGKLLVVLLFAAALSRISGSPLRGYEWALLGIGLATLHPTQIIIPVAWILALRWRKTHVITSRWRFNLAQVALVFLTLIALGVLFDAVRTGLILSPDMSIDGGGSSNNYLRWYVDRTPGALPVVGFVSLPFWCWRAFMLVWSSWLVFALLRWLRWSWESFAAGGLWRSKVAASM